MVLTAERTQADERIQALRRFSRFYTSVLGLLRGGLLESPYSLTEARVIYELAQAEASDATELREALGIDAGYLSRVLSHLEQQGLITRSKSPDDRRRQLIALTPSGDEAFRLLDQRSVDQVRTLIGDLGEAEQIELVLAMERIRQLLGDAVEQPLVVVRAPKAGELGWIVHRHGALYAEEYGWDRDFEALVAKIVAEFMERDDERERAWIAERAGAPVGCILCTAKSDSIAQLRLLLLEPRARGQGIGSRLVSECLDFARQAGYERVVLWTNDNLVAARRIYERAGFELDDEEPHHSFGTDLVGQTWSRGL